ncbi:hypothetical protein PILCRDRAFT_1329 [Piloderma croceum F 1598]|uniref:Uncharacterized protein n=1 Tax=Piloderma croceum (strain F 1598) TaxID=765440 RepID=A0A0C3GKK0_PILCF|nr:hypothetical protein PILCRDRAFT_1329 [Piloderma croceum F 1598]
MIAITHQNEIHTEMKAIMLMGSDNYLSSHPSKVVNWYMLRSTLLSNYEELRSVDTQLLRFPEMAVLRDYSIRGHELEGINLFDFILNTYEAGRNKSNSTNTVFVHYLPGTGKGTKGRVVRPSRQEIVPEMLGGWPPALDSCEDREMYEASMLLLFNPWQNLKELKNGHNSFGKAFAEFEGIMSSEVREKIDHIQSYYECEGGNQERIIDGNSFYDEL